MKLSSSLLALIPLAIGVAALSGRAGVLVEDKFTALNREHRDLSPSRGIWNIADGMATCTQDDALYKKNQDHGPVIWYDVAFTDGTVRFAYKPQKTKAFFFTLNNERGHVFRFVQNDAGLSVRGWPTPGPGAKPVSYLPPGTKTPALRHGEWAQVELKFEGNRCVLSIGDFKQTLEHPAIAQTKNKLGLGFSFGALSVRDVLVITP
ncbi:MAG: hypothetical protein K1X42_08555 [Opitutaceae bacterium]|nr:hypothetical protein [Opitutaceae bacterium]